MLSRDGEADRERTERLARAFPSSLRSDVTLISNAICPSGMEGHGVFVIVQNEPLQLPYRIEHTNDDSLFPQLNAHQALIYACIRSRHLDGYVRQRQIRRLACGAEPWVVPFLVQLGSEYVVEILHEIEACLPLLDKHLYGTILRSNPAFLDLAQQRMISYWDCYYRRFRPKGESYVGFRLFEQFRNWQAAG